jgi:hypothetical protein
MTQISFKLIKVFYSIVGFGIYKNSYLDLIRFKRLISAFVRREYLIYIKKNCILYLLYGVQSHIAMFTHTHSLFGSLASIVYMIFFRDLASLHLDAIGPSIVVVNYIVIIYK